MPEQLQIVIKGSQIRFVHDDDLAQALNLGQALTRRASHVEPAAGGWSADLKPVGGPVLGPFPRRDTALEEEIAWLQANLTPAPKQD
jgi:hypothetical protein